LLREVQDLMALFALSALLNYRFHLNNKHLVVKDA